MVWNQEVSFLLFSLYIPESRRRRMHFEKEKTNFKIPRTFIARLKLILLIEFL